MSPRGRGWIALLCAAAWLGCDPGKEIEEELDALASDHDILVQADQRILVGGYGSGGVRDACGSFDNDECEDDLLAIIDVGTSGQVSGVNTFGAQVYYRGDTTPGGGVLTLTVQHEEHAEDEDGQPDPPATVAIPIDVLPPEGAVVSPYCTPGSLGREPPYLAPAGGEVMVSWRFILDGRIEGGDDGTLPVSAPALELLDHSGPLAWYRVPSTPGLVEVSSTTYDSSFQLEIHDPADAVLVMGVTGLNFIGDAIQVDVHSEVDGRVVCAEPAGKTVTSETPAVCLIASGGQTAETQQISAAYVDVVPIAAGDCRIRATVADTALDEAIQFAVAPLGPEDMWWEHTCEGETTCGLVCQSSVIEDSGCEWTSTDEYTCDDDPAEIRCHYQQRYVGLECAETAEFPPYRVECWE